MNYLSWTITGLAIAGLILTSYLVGTTWFDHAILYCEDGSSCDLVQQSRWGTFIGIPTSLLGLMVYVTLLFSNLRVRNSVARWKSVWTLSLVGLTYSLYLQAVSLIVIESACIYCLASLSILAAIFVLATFQRPRKRMDFNFISWARSAVIVAAVVVGGMHLYYSGIFDPAAGPEDPYLKGLAQHLNQGGTVMYGAFW